MKIALFRRASEAGAPPCAGLVHGEIIQPVLQSLDELVRGAYPEPVGSALALVDVVLLPPVTSDCRGVLCVGINYVEHQKESADTFVKELPADPIVFFKTPSALTGPYDDLPLLEEVSSQFDFEVELGVVIGGGGRNLSRGEAGAHVFGYTVVNDITARDVQHRHKQWHLGKNTDASTPVGPWIVTADELGYPPAVDLSLRLNGVEMQSANTRDMVFDVADQIAVMSRHVALRPGDLLATGTPGGVGFARTPPRFLRDGDVLETVVDGVGTLRNVVRTGTLPEQEAEPLLERGSVPA